MIAKYTVALLAAAMLCVSTMAQEESAEDWYQKGQKLMENESYEEALKAYDSALQLDPENVGAWMGKGDTQVRMGDSNQSQKTYENALNITNKSLETNQQDAKVWLMKGELLHRLHRYDEALESYNRSLEIDPKDKEAWLNKGNALDTAAYQLQGLERLNAFEDAIIAYDEAIEIDPNYGNAWMKKGYSLHPLAVLDKNLSKHDESLRAFDRAIELIPDNDTRNLALAWEGRALALTGMGNTLEDIGRQDEAKERREEALEAYEKAIELDPNFTGLEARLNKAGILADLGRYNESIDVFDKTFKTTSIPFTKDIFLDSLNSIISSILNHSYRFALKCCEAIYPLGKQNRAKGWLYPSHLPHRVQSDYHWPALPRYQHDSQVMEASANQKGRVV